MEGNVMARPLDALNKARGKRVIVELKNNCQYTGKLQLYINTVLQIIWYDL